MSSSLNDGSVRVATPSSCSGELSSYEDGGEDVVRGSSITTTTTKAAAIVTNIRDSNNKKTTLASNPLFVAFRTTTNPVLEMLRYLFTYHPTTLRGFVLLHKFCDETTAIAKNTNNSDDEDCDGEDDIPIITVTLDEDDNNDEDAEP